MSTTLKANSADFLGNQSAAPTVAVTLATVLATLFAVKARESIDQATSGDKSDAAWIWGL